MSAASYTLGTLSYSSGTLTYDFTGNLFRLIPHGSNEPLSTTYSLAGGRWNPSNSFEVMYTFTNTTTARQYMGAIEEETGQPWVDVAPELQPDLLILDWTVSSLTDLATNEGLAVYNLPSTYPAGFEGVAGWPRAQPIGAAIHSTSAAGLVARSATAGNFSGDPIKWAEVAVFPERASTPTLVHRMSFEEWYLP